MIPRRVWAIEVMFLDTPGRWEGPGSDMDLFLLKAEAMKGARELRSEFSEGLRFRVVKYTPTETDD